jgi:gliding motility-associated-like protein
MKKIILLLLFVITFLNVNSQCNLLCNTDFEDVQVTTLNSYIILPQSQVPCWNTTASDGMVEVWGSGYNAGFGPVPSYSGNQFMELNANMVSTLYQNFYAGIGTNVNIQFAHRGRGGIDSMSVSIGLVGGPYVTLGIFGDGNISWGYYSVNYNIPTLGNYSLRFNSISYSATTAGNFLDDISIIVNPSPTANAGIDMNSGSVLNGSGTGIAPLSYSWSPSYGLNATNISNPLATPTITTIYTLTITDAIGCTVSDTVVVFVPNQICDAGLNDTICLGDTVQLNASNSLIYDWTNNISLNDTDIANPLVYPLQTTTYYLNSQTIGTNMVVNGDFELGNTGFITTYTYCNTFDCLNPLSNNGYSVGVDANFFHTSFIGHDHTTGSGNFMIINGANPSLIVWKQTINITPNTEYGFGCWINTMTFGGPSGYPSAEIRFSINGTQLGPIYDAPDTVNIWDQVYITWNSGSNTTATIEIVDVLPMWNGNDFGLDDIFFADLNSCVDSVTIFVNSQAPTINLQTICNGSSYTFNGHSYTTSGIYYDTLTIGNCYNVFETQLTVIPIYSTNNPQTICNGSIYNINGHSYNTPGSYYDTLTSINGCDSVIITLLTVNSSLSSNNLQNICNGDNYSFNGHIYTVSGIYYDTLTSINGCDSVIITQLNVNQVYSINNPQTVCNGFSYIINGHTYSVAGIYYDTLTSINGCDSIIITQLSVNQGYLFNNTQTICDGDSYSINGHLYTTTGVYLDTLNTINGCDSIITTNLNVGLTYSINNPQIICDGLNYIINGHSYTTTGTYFDTLLSTNGCDSIIITQLTVNSNILLNPQIICNGLTYNINGNIYNISGTYYDTISTSTCDSIIITQLTVNPNYNINNPQTICNGDNYTINGNIYVISGTYIDTLTTIFGCDSIITTQLNVSTTNILNLGNDTVICNGQTLILDAGNIGIWSTGENSQTILVSVTGTYSVTVSNGNCENSDTINIYIPPDIDLGRDISLCNEKEISLSVNFLADYYLWSNGSNSSSITIDSPGEYWVDVQIGSCELSDTINIIGGNNSIYVPNAFTPDNDNLNEIFLPIVQEGVNVYNLKIFTRWGQMIFETSEYNVGWNGTFEGIMCENVVYVWLITYSTTCTGERILQKSGSITLIK